MRQRSWHASGIEAAFKKEPLTLLTSANLIPSTGPCFTSDSADMMAILGLINQSSKNSRRSSLVKIKGMWCSQFPSYYLRSKPQV